MVPSDWNDVGYYVSDDATSDLNFPKHEPPTCMPGTVRHHKYAVAQEIKNSGYNDSGEKS